MLLVWMKRMGVVLLVWFLGTALAYLFFQIPSVRDRMGWRLDAAVSYLRDSVYPAGEMPTPLPTAVIRITEEKGKPTEVPVFLETKSANTIPPSDPTQTPTAAPLPERASLTIPNFEFQDWNNCGPATLSIYLQYYGWEGTQTDIADLVKPVESDRNVNIEEMAYYVRTRAGWLQVEYRVGGDIDLLRRFLAEGVPVMVEVGFLLDPDDPGLRHDDDRWTGHYLLLTGYSDQNQTFTAQNVFVGPDQTVSYKLLEKDWAAFNHVYLVVFTPEQKPLVEDILGIEWDPEKNRQQALEGSQELVDDQPENAFAWFNYGTNLVPFQRYAEAAQAYDRARLLGLPQRMLRYQFGPFMAYFHAGRIDELMALTDYALKITPNSQEAWLWRGWALYRQNDRRGAIESFRKAMESNPDYEDALYAIDFVQNN